MVRTKKISYATHKKYRDNVQIGMAEELIPLIAKRVDQGSFSSRSYYIRSLILNDLLLHNIITPDQKEFFLSNIYPTSETSRYYMTNQELEEKERNYQI